MGFKLSCFAFQPILANPALQVEEKSCNQISVLPRCVGCGTRCSELRCQGVEMFLVVASNFRSGATRTPADPPTILYIRDILDRFRPRLFELGRPVWKTQADVPTKLLFLN